MAELGINVLDANGKLRDMGGVIEQIGTKWEGMTREQQISLAQIMAGQRQYSNLIALFDNFDKYNEAMQTAAGAAGTLQEQQDIYMESTAAHLQQLKASVEDIQDSLFNMDSMDQIIDALSSGGALFANFIDSIGGGGQLLKSLGTIAVGVFSNQIAKSINISINNMQLAKQRAAQLQEKLKFGQDLGRIEGLDELSKKLIQDETAAIRLAKALSPEQYGELQNLFSGFEQNANKIQIADQKLQEIKATIDSFMGEGFSEKIFGQNVEQSTAAWQQFNEKVLDNQIAFQELSQKAEQFSQKLKQIQSGGIKVDSVDVVKQKYEDLYNIIYSVITEINGIAGIGSNSKMSEIINDFADLKDIKNLEDYGKALEQITKKLNTFINEASETGDIKVVEKLKQLQEQAQTAQKDLEALNKFGGFTNIKKAYQELETEIEKYIAELQKASSTGPADPKQTQALEALKQLLEQVKNATAEDAQGLDKQGASVQLLIKNFTELVQKVQEYREARMKAVNSEFMQNAYSSQKERAEAEAQLQREKIQKILQSGERQIKIKAFTDITAGLGQVAMGIQQIQNLGSIWKNSDLNAGQKMLQTVINMSFSLPMLINGFNKLNTTLKLFGFLSKQQTAELLKQQGALVGTASAQGLFNVSVEEGTVVVTVFGRALTMTPLGAFIALLGIAATALGTFIHFQQQAREETIKSAQEKIEDQKKTQEQIKSHEQLYTSLQDLNNQYKSGQITRAELQTSVKELASQYDQEDTVVKQLTSSYGDLTAAIERAKEADAENLLESAKTAQAQARKKYEEVSKQGIFNVKEVAAELPQAQASDVDKKVVDILGKSDIAQIFNKGTRWGVNIDVSNPEKVLEFYENLNNELKQMGISQSQLADSKYYDIIEDKLAEVLKTAKEVNGAFEDTQSILTRQTGQKAEEQGLIDLKNVDSISEYTEQVRKLQDIMNNTEGIQNGAEAAMKYLQLFGGQAQAKFGPFMEFLTRINPEIALTQEAVEALYNSLSEDQLNRLLEIDPQNYATAKDFVEMINDILRNPPEKAYSVDQLQGQLETAAQNYQTINDIQKKIEEGNLSLKEGQEILQAYPELADYFVMDIADGTYKLKQGAQGFKQTIQSIKLQPLLDTLSNINNQLGKIPQKATLQNITQQQQNISSPLITPQAQQDTQKQLANDQLSVISQSDPMQMNQGLQQWISDTQTLIEKGGQLKGVYDSIDAKFKEVAGGSAEELLQKQEELNQQADQINQALKKALDPLDEDIDTEQFNQMVKLIEDGAVKIEDWPKNLDMSKDDMQDLAEAILRFQDAGQDVTKNFDKWKKALGSGGSGIARNINQIRDAYGDLFDLDDTSLLPSDFLNDVDNLDLMKAAIEGDADAYDNLANTLSQEIHTNLDSIMDQFGATQDQIDNVHSAFDTLDDKMRDMDWSNATDVEAVRQSCQSAIDSFMAMGMSAQQAVAMVQAAYPGLNMDVTIDSKKDQQTDQIQVPYFEYTEDSQNFSWSTPIFSSRPTGAQQGIKSYSYQSGTSSGTGKAGGVKVTTGTEPVQGTKETTGQSVKVNKVGPAASGKTKVNNSTHKGGGKGGGKKGGGSCFAAQTLITIPNNKYRFIEEIQVGDIVLSYNVDKNINEYSEVLQTMIHDIAQDVYHIYIENDVITATAIHPFFIIRDNCCYWIEVSELKAGDIVLFSNGTTHKISNIVKEYKEIKVYNFEVAGNHNYYVGINGILVHNKGKGKKGKEGKADTSKVHAKKSTVEKADPYFKINRTLGNLQTSLKRVAKAQEKAFGKDREKQLKTQLDLLEKQNKALKDKQKINAAQINSQKNTLSATQKNTRSAEKQRRKQLSAKTVQKQSQKAIAKNKLKKETIKGGYGLTIDNDGEIAEGSYEQRYKYYQQQIEARWKEYQAAEKIYNSAQMAKKGNADKKKAYKQNVLDILKYNYDLWVKQLDKFKDKVQDYTKDLDLRQSLEDQISQVEDRKIQIEIEKYNAKVQLTLDLKQADREWNEFIKNVTKHIDVFKKTDMKQLTLELTLNKDNLINDIDALKNSNSLINKVKDLTAKINKSMNGAKDDVYGDNFAKMEEDLQEYSKKLREALQQALEDEDAAKEAYLSMVDAYIDGYDTIIDKQTSLNDLYEYNIDLIKLVGGTNKETYEMITNQYTGLLNNQQTAMKTMKQQLEYYKAQMKVNENNPAVLAKYQEAYRNMLNTLNSAVTQSINALRQRYENQIDRLMDALDRELSGGRALDYLDMQWELMNQNSEMYLDTVNSIYSIQSLQNKFQTAIDSTKNLKTQQRLKKVMEEQLTTLKKKDKLTQYDVDRAEKVLEVQKARMELEEAKANKTQLRLTRDSQGNYSYQFAADAQGVQDSLNKLLDAQNALYNFDKQAYQNNLNDALAAYKNFQSQYIDILKDTELSEEEKEKRITLLKEQYGQYINALTEENENIRLNLSQSTLDSIVGFYEKEAEAFAKLKNEQRDLIIPIAQQGYQSFKQLNDEEQKAINNYIVPQWSKGVETMIEAFRGKGVDGKPSFLNACSKTFEEIEAKGIEFQSKMNSTLGNIAKQSKSSLDTVKNGIQNIDTVLSNAADTAKKKFGPELESSLTTAKELINQTIEASKQLEQLKATAEKAAVAAKTAVDQAKGKIVQQKTSGNPSSSTGSGSTATSNTSQAINSVSSAQAAAQQMVITNKDNQTRKRAATEYIKAHANKTSTKKSKLAAVNQKIYDKTKGKILSAAELKQLAKMLGVTYNNASSSGNLYKKLKQIGYFAKGSKYIQDDLLAWTQELGQELIYDKSKKAMLTPLGKGDKVFTAQMTDNLWKIAKNNGLNNQKTLKSLGQKLIAVNEQELQAYNKNKLNIIDILKSISNSLPNAISDKIGSLNNNYVKELASIITREIIANNAATADSVQQPIQQTVKITATFPAVNSKKEIEEAFADLVNLATQRTLR